MMGVLKYLTKRPSDKTIRIGRVIGGLILIIGFYYNFFFQETPNQIQSNLFWNEFSDSTITYIKYGLVGIGLIPLLFGIFDFCFMKSKYVRMVQVFFAIVLFYISSIIIETPDLDIDVLIWLMGFFLLIVGISGKGITKKGLKCGYKVTKIRV